MELEKPERPQTPVGVKVVGGAVVVIVGILAVRWVLGLVSLIFNLLVVALFVVGAFYLYRLFTRRS